MNNSSDREEAIFEQAVNYTSDRERAAFLDQVCGGDRVLRARLDLLLEGYFKAEGFLTREPESHGNSPDEAIGSKIGRFKLLEKIGEGGFGAVYVAEQSEPVKRRVALKIIKLGMDTKQVVTRFEAERQALALMDHPNIAKVHDGGATETGRPYFVMELVRGLPITKYAEENGLSIDERLKLFTLVCQAVQHAHQKGIIHRDLKPSNILVTVNDGVAVPKVIDFGVAKATQQELTEKTIFTQFHHFIGTPAYMSPEQAEMTSVDIDTRSDIYSLGVLLYELLTGKPPFDGKELLASGLDAMRRTIREQEPLRPSTRLARERSSVQSALRAPHSAIDPDLDWIVMKCLEKDRARRYDTANSLVSDIERHLNDEAIAARPPSAVYRFGKFVRRHKLEFAAAAALAAVLIAASAVSAWQAIEARRAEREQAQARAIAERRLRTALRYADRISRDVAPQLWELIGAARISETLTTNTVVLLEELDSVDETDPEYRRILGQIYQRLGLLLSAGRGNSLWDPEAGLKASREAIRLLQPVTFEHASDDHILQLVRTEQNAAVASLVLEQFDEALSHFRVMERWIALITNSPSVGREAQERQWTAQGGPARVVFRKKLFGEALTNYYMPRLQLVVERGIPETPNANDHMQLSMAHKWVAICCLKLGRKVEALSHCREAVRVGAFMTNLAPNNAEFANYQNELAAQLGESLLALYQPEGVERLQEALDAIKLLRARDRGNTGFVLNQIIALKYFVSGLTFWAQDPAATPAERRERLEQAQVLLESADQLIGRFPSESARRVMRSDLEPARTNLVATRLKFAEE